ncbi:MAG: ATP-binding protein [Verrucomicrobiae bacterium]|nr:ATP-binding protein [Verrucomicrobiae bacterium]
MIPRQLMGTVLERLSIQSAVALLGPRQMGKTTLALQIAESRPSLYLDLESEADRSRLAEPELYLAGHVDKLVILDEVQRQPGLFQSLRGLIDRGRRHGTPNGRFLLLGSASPELLRQSGETLAGRISYLELPPLGLDEVDPSASHPLWVQGGFPESYLARDIEASLLWRRDFIRTYLERDIPQLGPRIAAETLRRFWTMLAHRHGQLHNAAELARGLAVAGKTVAAYVDLFVDLLLVRRLEPWHANSGKRLVKSPRLYLRDSGLLHSLLGISDLESLLGHPIVGSSWEGFLIENLLAAAPESARAWFYRTAAGAEIDLVLDLPRRERWAIEIKRTLAPSIPKGFACACADLAPTRRWIVYPGEERFPLDPFTEAIPPLELLAELRSFPKPPAG